MKTQTGIKMLTAAIKKAPKSDQISRLESNQANYLKDASKDKHAFCCH